MKLIQACRSLKDVSEIVQTLYEETKMRETEQEISKTRVSLAWSSLVQIFMEHLTTAEEKFLEIVS